MRGVCSGRFARCLIFVAVAVSSPAIAPIDRGSAQSTGGYSVVDIQEGSEA